MVTFLTDALSRLRCISLPKFSVSSQLMPSAWPENEAVGHCHQMDHVNGTNREMCSCLAGHADALPLRTQQC